MRRSSTATRHDPTCAVCGERVPGPQRAWVPMHRDSGYKVSNLVAVHERCGVEVMIHGSVCAYRQAIGRHDAG